MVEADDVDVFRTEELGVGWSLSSRWRWEERLLWSRKLQGQTGDGVDGHRGHTDAGGATGDGVDGGIWIGLGFVGVGIDPVCVMGKVDADYPVSPEDCFHVIHEFREGVAAQGGCFTDTQLIDLGVHGSLSVLLGNDQTGQKEGGEEKVFHGIKELRSTGRTCFVPWNNITQARRNARDGKVNPQPTWNDHGRWHDQGGYSHRRQK